MGCGSMEILEKKEPNEMPVINEDEVKEELKEEEGDLILNRVNIGTEFICIYSNADHNIFNSFNDIDLEEYGEESKSIYQQCKSNLEDIKNKVTYEINSNEIKFKVIDFIPDFKFIYFHTKNLKTIKLTNFDVSHCDNISSLFIFCYSLEYLDLSNLNTINIIDMSFMFSGCLNLKKIEGLKNFNTENVINMKSMFQKCTSL